MRRLWRRVLDPWVEISWRKKWQSTLVFLPGKFHRQRSLAGYSPWGCKELDTAEDMHTHTHTQARDQGGKEGLGAGESDVRLWVRALGPRGGLFSINCSGQMVLKLPDPAKGGLFSLLKFQDKWQVSFCKHQIILGFRVKLLSKWRSRPTEGQAMAPTHSRF